EVQHAIAAVLCPPADLVEEQLLRVLADEFAEGGGQVKLHYPAHLGDDRRRRRAISQLEDKQVRQSPERPAKPFVIRALEVVRLLGAPSIHRRLVRRKKLVEVAPIRIDNCLGAGFLKLGDLRAMVAPSVPPNLLFGKLQIDRNGPAMQKQLAA